jgi:sortase A
VNRFLDRLLDALANSARARRGLTATAILLVAAAVGTLAYPVYTDLYHNDLQGKLSDELSSAQIRQAYMNVVVVQGIDTNSLKAGAGHYPETPLPCQSGDVAIAGHRTTYGKPFANIDRLAPADRIILTTPVGSCIYEVSRAPFVVSPDDWAVVANTPGEFQLTLTACHPKGSASHRIIVKAAMISSTATL